jgi:hypothetical protein
MARRLDRGMYQERYDPVLHPDEVPAPGSTLTRIFMISVVVSGSLCLYVVARMMG